MAVGITPIEGAISPRRSAKWPLLAESALVAAAIAGLLPLFAALSSEDTGRNERFAPYAVATHGLEQPVLPHLCAARGKFADDPVRIRLCSHSEPSSTARDRASLVLSGALSHVEQDLVTPLEQARARVVLMQQPLRAGATDEALSHRDVDEALVAIAPTLRRYVSSGDRAELLRAPACAYESLQRALAGSTGVSTPSDDSALANAVLLLGAALDGNASTAAALQATRLPDARAESSRCAGFDFRKSLAATATLMADARTASVNAAKDDAMRTLLRTARWQWAAWAVIGLALLNVHRSGVRPLVGVGLTLGIWGVVAWVARVPWPFSTGHASVFARPPTAFTAMPASFVVWMLAASASALVIALLRAARAPTERSAPASVSTYPGLVAATGIGWLVLLDLSANGNFSNRYIALYHQGHLWLGMLTFTMFAFLRQPIGRGLSWTLSLIDGIASRIERRLGLAVAAMVFLLLALACAAVLAGAFANMRQLTSELGRLWLMVGAAWFFFMRGTPLTERAARRGNSAASLARYAWPLLFVVITLVAAMLMTRDMGPLLISGYGAGAFVAASVAMWFFQRYGWRGGAYAIAVPLFAAWIVVTTLALFKVGSVDQVTAERIENASAPLASASDQMALITWFQRAAPPEGFGPGAVPWCGFAASTTCGGVPAQIQSDYTLTALVGIFGWTAAWAITLGSALWLYEAVRPHGRVTRGEPRLVRFSGRLRNDEQAFLSWLALAWLVLTLCQLAVTVGGNLTVIPLTGVTFPFVSFGMTSLISNMAILGLAIDVGTRGASR